MRLVDAVAEAGVPRFAFISGGHGRAHHAVRAVEAWLQASVRVRCATHDAVRAVQAWLQLASSSLGQMCRDLRLWLVFPSLRLPTSMRCSARLQVPWRLARPGLPAVSGWWEKQQARGECVCGKLPEHASQPGVDSQPQLGLTEAAA